MEPKNVERHPGPYSGQDAEFARACAMAVIPFYGNDDEVTHWRIMKDGIWNDHIAVQSALAAIHNQKPWTAPGSTDFSFGSTMSTLIGFAFNRIETLDQDAPHRYYLECRFCRGTDMNNPNRRRGERRQINLVEHAIACSFHKSLPRLQAMANRDVT